MAFVKDSFLGKRVRSIKKIHVVGGYYEIGTEFDVIKQKDNRYLVEDDEFNQVMASPDSIEVIGDIPKYQETKLDTWAEVGKQGLILTAMVLSAAESLLLGGGFDTIDPPKEDTSPEALEKKRVAEKKKWLSQRDKNK